MFEAEKAFYEAHKAEFREKYLNKWLVIVGDSLFGVFDTTKEACETVMQLYEPGEFMVHRPADDGMVIEFGPIISVHRPGDSQKPKQFISACPGEPVTFAHA